MRACVLPVLRCHRDAATTIVPGSHKSLLLHPRVHSKDNGEGNMRVDGATLEGAVEVHLKAGDAVRPPHCRRRRSHRPIQLAPRLTANARCTVL